ncbi:hypothetical protein ACFYWS_11975 [Streptomyces sp. NPDC002795]|uniref:hypothetical protein n=1 Tax=Streptomyces sp. NPDC002795 TaxID=3364665 RepID=UPI0036D13134
MFTHVELWPDPDEGLTRGPDPFTLPSAEDDSTLIGRLKRLYLVRLRQYEVQLRDAFRKAAGSAHLRGLPQESGYPEVPVAGREEVVVFDRDLYRQLFDLYTYQGWTAITAVADAIEDRLTAEDRPLALAQEFFRFTQRVLYLLIRQELIEIERLAAERLTLQLSHVASELAAAWKHFGFHRIKVDVPLGYYATIAGKAWAFKDPGCAEAVYKAMRTAHAQRKKCDALVGDKEQQPGEAARAALELYESMRRVIHLNAPLALLALNSMEDDTKRWQMEHLIGRTLKEFLDRADRLGEGIDAGRSISSAVLRGAGPRWEDGLPVTVDNISEVVIEPPGPEAALIDWALARLGPSAAYFPLVCDSMLDTLAETGVVRRDSFTRVVRQHYVAVLRPELEERRKSSALWEGFWSTFSKLASAISLVLLFTPAAEIAPGAVTAARIADAILLAHTLHTVTGQLSMLDEILSTLLMRPNALALPALARLGELRAYRAQYIDNVDESLLLFVFSLGPGQWAEVRPLLELHGYYGDLRTVLGL